MDYSGWSGVGAFAPPVQKRYGGFWLRVVAYFLDAILLVIAQVILMQVVKNEAAAQGVNFLLTWFYFAGLESMAGATLGVHHSSTGEPLTRVMQPVIRSRSCRGRLARRRVRRRPRARRS